MDSPVNEIFKSLSSLKEELNEQNKVNLKQKNLEKVKQFLLERKLLKENIDLISHTSVNNLKNHNLYSEAKTGDLRFAKELIKYLVKEEKIKEIINKFPNANLVPLVKTGRTNKIPYAYALYLKSKNRNYKIANITQINKIKKTERSGIYRLINVNEFSGEIIPNENYIIIDDVITTGSTIKSLENFIKENGGNVVLITTLASASNPLLGHASKNYNFNQELFDLIEKNIGVENVQNLFKKYGHDVQLDKLTSNQLKILSIYKDINKLEDKLKIEKNMPLNEIFNSLTSLQEELTEQKKLTIKETNLMKVQNFIKNKQNKQK